MVSEVSILIPVYNYCITPLVKTLLSQCRQAIFSFEIICLDDASEELFQLANREVGTMEHVVYEELPTNISRAAMRNVLAAKARYAYLLFLDNDSEIYSKQFIRTYLQAAQPDTILIGGTVYQPHKPSPTYRLHWQYGHAREQRPAIIRNRQPHRRVQTNNLLINRTLYLKHPIPETITTYGHEDTQWGHYLEKVNVAIRHIDNPVCHAGLEPAPLFLAKAEQAVANLFRLSKTEEIDSPLLTSYSILIKLGVTNLFRVLFNIIRVWLQLNLLSNYPKLFCFDIYKLGLLVNSAKRKAVQ